MKRLLVVLVILLLACLAGMWWLAGFAMTGKRQSLEEALEWQAERYDVSFYDELEKHDYTVSGQGGYTLHVQELVNPTPTTRYVILSHGYTDNRIGSLKYVPMYLALGYNCIIYDLRGHGLNEATCTTYGLLEGEDLAKLVEDTRERYADLSQLGLHGESLGAATTISSLRYRPNVDFVVSDCAFADIVSVLRDGYRAAGAPVFLVDLADVGARLRYHYALKDMRPIDALEGNTVPVLFVHGLEDDLISSDNARALYDKTEGPRELYLVEGAGHAESVLVAPEEYREKVTAFLQSLEG